MKLARLVLAVAALSVAGACSSSVTGPSPRASQTEAELDSSTVQAPSGIGTWGSGG